MKCVNVETFETANFQSLPKDVAWLSEEQTRRDWMLRVYDNIGNGNRAQRLFGRYHLALEILEKYKDEG